MSAIKILQARIRIRKKTDFMGNRASWGHLAWKLMSYESQNIRQGGQLVWSKELKSEMVPEDILWRKLAISTLPRS